MKFSVPHLSPTSLKKVSPTLSPTRGAFFSLTYFNTVYHTLLCCPT